MNDHSTTYPADETCVVCGHRPGGSFFSHIRYKDQMLPLCCPLCLDTFQKNPDYYDILREAENAFKAVKKPES